MYCYFCGSDQSSVIDKRAVKSSGEIRRRRECLKCHRRFTTYERIFTIELFVIKKDGRREIFSIDKLRSGVAKALEKRPAATEVEAIVKRVESKLRDKGKKDIETHFIGQTVLGELKKLDKVAYLRFASVYRDFSDPGDFRKELESLKI